MHVGQASEANKPSKLSTINRPRNLTGNQGNIPLKQGRVFLIHTAWYLLGLNMTVWLFIHLRAWSTCEKRGTAMAAGNRSLNIWNLLQSFHPDKSVDPRINISSNTRSVQTTESLGISQLFQATWQLTRGYLALISWFCVMWNLSNRFHVVVPLYSCTVQL